MYRINKALSSVSKLASRYFSSLDILKLGKPSISVNFDIVKYTGPDEDSNGTYVEYAFESKSKSSETIFNGKDGNSLFVHNMLPSKILKKQLYVGLGNDTDFNLDGWRKAAYTTTKTLKQEEESSATVVLSVSQMLPGISNPTAVQIREATNKIVPVIASTIVLSNYSFNKYKSDDKTHKVKNIKFAIDVDDQLIPALTAKIADACTLVEYTCAARDLGNEQADVANPCAIESLAKEIARTHSNMTMKVLGRDDLEAKGLMMHLAVGQAANSPPRLVILEYSGDDSTNEKTALVGKGITFDTGGLNLKPTGYMETMHLDMHGCATVLNTIAAASRLNLKSNIVAALPLAENAIDASSYKPGAILKSLNGKTVQVGNTDAEGRLVLADALTYIQQQYKPHTVIDVATLTGACLVALGETTAGVFSNNDELSDSLIKAGAAVSEPCWRLPINEEHVSEITRPGPADIHSTGSGRYGGACTAAAFLKEFINEETKWAHIDIAGPAMLSKSRDWKPKDGTGFGVQLLVEYLRNNTK